MISCDTNVLFAACVEENANHARIADFLSAYLNSRDFVLCEQVLMELYCLLRNPKVSVNPLTAPEAAKVISSLRSNPAWRIVDIPEDASVMKAVWDFAKRPGVAFRRVFDRRLSETLLYHGVDTFATRNVRDFADAGFKQLVNPWEA
jgi:toxin-antitoxin system PIN domain toxin